MSHVIWFELQVISNCISHPESLNCEATWVFWNTHYSHSSLKANPKNFHRSVGYCGTLLVVTLPDRTRVHIPPCTVAPQHILITGKPQTNPSRSFKERLVETRRRGALFDGWSAVSDPYPSTVHRPFACYPQEEQLGESSRKWRKRLFSFWFGFCYTFIVMEFHLSCLNWLTFTKGHSVTSLLTCEAINQTYYLSYFYSKYKYCKILTCLR